MAGVPQTSVIHLFQRNLEAESENEDDLEEQIRVTVLHETATTLAGTTKKWNTLG